MTSHATSAPATTESGDTALARLTLRLASMVIFGVVPALTLVLYAGELGDDTLAADLGQFYDAAEAILHGENPYSSTAKPASWGGPYPYPPLPALFAVPLTVLPFQVAGVLVMVVLVGVALAVPAVLGVRDWRCYGLLLVWPPVITAVQTANVTLWFALAAAIAWRFRDRVWPVSASIGLTLAAKFFLWPLVVWLAATRRVASMVWTCVAGAVLLLLSWAPLGFAGLVEYPALLRRLEDAVGLDSYTTYVVGLDLGLPSALSRAVWLGIGLGILAFVVVLARRGDERTAFILAITAALALTPIVWSHYFSLLLVVVALAQPRLSLVWFVPLGMIITPSGHFHPTPFQTSWTLLVAAATIGLAVRASLRRAGPVGSDASLEARPA